MGVVWSLSVCNRASVCITKYYNVIQPGRFTKTISTAVPPAHGCRHRLKVESTKLGLFQRKAPPSEPGITANLSRARDLLTLLPAVHGDNALYGIFLIFFVRDD